MKRLALICVVLMAGCSEHTETYPLSNEWTVLWQLQDEEIKGDLTFFNDNYAQLEVYGQPNSLLVQENTSINFYWHTTGNELILRRLDNDLELKYRILKQTPEYMELAFADDITLKLYRN